MAKTSAVGGRSTLFGCVGLRGPIDAFGKRFDLLELDPKWTAAKLATFRKMRKDAGPRLAFAIPAPPAVAAVRPGPAMDQGIEDLLAAQRALQARFLLLHTPVEVTPGELSRERLAKVVERLRKGLGEAAAAVRIVWQPRGVWEPASAAAFAEKLGVDLSLDPLADPREPFWHATLRYVRLSPIGGRGAFPPARLRQMAELLVATAPHQKGERVIVFATPKGTADAKRLRTLVKQMSEKAPRGGGRVVSPRGRARAEEEE